MKYFLWNTQRQGWLTTFGTTTDRAEAIKVDEATAQQRRIRHMLHDGVPGVVPVPCHFFVEEDKAR